MAGSRVRKTIATRMSSRRHVMASSAQSSIPWKPPADIAATTGADMTAAIPTVTSGWSEAVDDAGAGVCMACPVDSECMAKTEKSSAARASREIKGDTETDEIIRRTARAGPMSPPTMPSAQKRTAHVILCRLPHGRRGNPECPFRSGTIPVLLSRSRADSAVPAAFSHRGHAVDLPHETQCATNFRPSWRVIR